MHTSGLKIHDLFDALAERVAAKIRAGNVAGRMAVVFPHYPEYPIAVMTTVPWLFAQAVQHAVEAEALIEYIAADGCLAVVVPAGRALSVARLFSSTEEGSRRFGVV